MLKEGGKILADIERLKLIIKERGLKNKYLAKELGITEAAYYSKMSGKRKFNVDEAAQLVGILNISNAVAYDIFFKSEVDNISTYKRKEWLKCTSIQF